MSEEDVLTAFHNYFYGHHHPPVYVIDATPDAVRQFRQTYRDWGTELIVLSRAEIEKLLKGKVLALPCNGGEYTHFIVSEEEPGASKS